MSDSQLVNVVILENPLRPQEAVREQVEWTGDALGRYLGPLSPQWVVTLNGGVVESTQYDLVVPAPDDWIVVCPNLTNGGSDGESSGKTILRAVALIVISIYAPGWGASLAGATGVGTGAMWAAGIMVGGAMLVNAVLPMPSMDTSADSFDTSPTYGIDGAKNTSIENIPVPLCYGQHRMAGNIISLYTENRGNEQFLRMLINAGAGPVEDLTDIEINEQPASAYSNVTLHKRLGYDNQEYVPGFADIVTPINKGISLEDPGIWLTHTTDVCDQVRVDLVFPEGLATFSEKGRLRNMTVGLNIEIRAAEPIEITPAELPEYVRAWLEASGADMEAWIDGLNDWQPYSYEPTKTITPVGGVINATYMQYVAQLQGSSVVQVTDATRSVLRRSFTSQPLPRGKYEVRIRRTAAGGASTSDLDAVGVTDINEIVFGGPRYNHTALLGLEILLTNQLSSIPRVTYLNKGRLIKVWDFVTRSWTIESSSNPAWIVYDALTDTREGAGQPEDRIDLPAFKRWARYCEANDLTFNGVIDQFYTLWDALAPVYRAGRAQPVKSGTKHSVSIEMAKAPSMMFSAGNIRTGSFGMRWLALDDRANELEVTYFDKRQKHAQRTIVIADDEAIARGAPVVKSQMTLVGVDDEELAMRHAKYSLNYNKLGLVCSFDAPLEAIACSIGDVVLVQHDMPQWGQAGRLGANSASPTQIQLDKPVTLVAGQAYRAMLKVDAAPVVSGTVLAMEGRTAWLSGFNPASASNVRVLAVDGVEYPVEDVLTDYVNGRHGVTLIRANGLAAGLPYQLYNTDVTLFADVTSPAGDTDIITLAAPFASAGVTITPQAGQMWALGQINRGPKPFVVRKIRTESDQWRTLECLEYDERVFDDEIIDFVPSHSEIGNLAPATLKDIREDLVEINGAYQTQVTFEWEHPDPTYTRANVFVSFESGEYRLIGTGIHSISFAALPGIDLAVKIQPVDSAGRVLNFEAVPAILYTVQGAIPLPPERPINFVAFPKIRSVDLRWYTQTHTTDGDFDYGTFEVWYAPITDATPNPQVEQAVLIATVTKNYYQHENRAPLTRHRYWLRAVDPVSPTLAVSAWAPDIGGLTVETLLDTDFGIIFPSGVSSSNLTQELGERIDLIDDPDNGLVGRVDEVEDVVEEMYDGLADINARLANVEGTAAFDPASPAGYPVGTIVRYEGGLYRAQVDMLTPPYPLPTDPAHWEKIGDYESIGDAVTAHALILDDHETRITESEELLEVTAQQTDALASGMVDLEQEISLQSTAINQLTTRVTDTEGGLATQSGQVIALESKLKAMLDPAPGGRWDFDNSMENWVAGGASLAQPEPGLILLTGATGQPWIYLPTALSIEGRQYRYVAMRVKLEQGTWRGICRYMTANHGYGASHQKVIGAPVWAADGWGYALFDMHELTAGGQDWKESTITGLRFDLAQGSPVGVRVDWIVVGRESTPASARALSALTTRVQQTEDAISSHSDQITDLENEVNHPTSGLSAVAAATASLGTRIEATEDAIESTSTSLTQLGNTVSDIETGMSGVANAIDQLTTTVTIDHEGAIEAHSQSLMQLEAIVGPDFAVLQEMYDVTVGLDGLSAMWTIKTDVNGHVAGIGLFNDGNISQFIVRASQFGVSDPSAPTIYPLQVVNGKVIIEGVYIREASIVNAQLGGLLSSNNYIPGFSGWAIDKTTGAAEFGAITIRASDGTVLLASGGNISALLDNRQQLWNDVGGPGKPASNATRNIVYRQTTQPTSGANGDLWYNTATSELYRFNGAAWENIGNGYNNTSQLSDDAGLGQTAVWQQIFGPGKPVDGATRNNIYRQAAAPAGAAGDLWHNTNNGYLYRHSGAAWELVGTVGADGATLRAGIGANLLQNSAFRANTDLWTFSATSANFSAGRNYDPSWQVSGEGTLWIRQAGAENIDSVWGTWNQLVPVSPGMRLEAFAYTGVHRCICRVTVAFYNTADQYITEIVAGTNNQEAAGGPALASYKKTGGFVTVPAGAAKAMFFVRKGVTLSGGDSYLFFARCFLGEATAGQTELSPWSEGAPGGAFSTLNQITPQNVSTYIAALSVGTIYIGRNAISVPVGAYTDGGVGISDSAQVWPSYYASVQSIVVSNPDPWESRNVLVIASFAFEGGARFGGGMLSGTRAQVRKNGIAYLTTLNTECMYGMTCFTHQIPLAPGEVATIDLAVGAAMAAGIGGTANYTISRRSLSAVCLAR